jgi:hypothetical protein
MDWALEVVAPPVSDLAVIDEADGGTFSASMIPDDHTGLRDWANR